MPATGCPSGCGRDVETGRTFCALCWAMLPDKLRRDVTLTLRGEQLVRGRKSSTPAERRAGVNAHRAAVAAALHELTHGLA